MGLRSNDHNTAFPAGITTGATWDRDLMYKRGKGIGEEAKGKGIHIILGPTVGPLGRKPRGGRNWEGFSVDSYLMSEASYYSVKVCHCEPGPCYLHAKPIFQGYSRCWDPSYHQALYRK